MRRRLPRPLALTVLAIALTSQGVLAASLIKASDSRPTFTACSSGATQPPNRPSFNYRDSEVEPSLALNPKTVANLIAAWHHDRWSDGGADGLTGGASF